MTKSKPAALSSGLIAAKGRAAPAIPDIPAQAPAQVTVRVELKSLTVKLDRVRFAALKSAGVHHDKSSQAILVEALDIWLKMNT